MNGLVRCWWCETLLHFRWALISFSSVEAGTFLQKDGGYHEHSEHSGMADWVRWRWGNTSLSMRFLGRDMYSHTNQAADSRGVTALER